MKQKFTISREDLVRMRMALSYVAYSTDLHIDKLERITTQQLCYKIDKQLYPTSKLNKKYYIKPVQRSL